MEARRVEARKEEALVALETALSTEEVEELRTSTEAAWHSEQDAERLQAKVVLVCEEVLARAQRMLQQARATRDQDELRKVGLEAVSTADKDTLCVIAVKAAAQEGVDMNTRAEAAAGEEPKERWLSVAAKEGLGETVRALLETGAEVDHVNNLGRTALWGAALHGRVEALQALLAAGAEVDHEDNRGQSALGHAASNGKVEAVQALLAAGAEVNHASNLGHTALSGAAGNGHVGAIQVLLEAGAEVDHVNINGCTALCVAASNGEVDAVRALLAAGAGVNRASNNGYTALWGAALCGKVEAIRALLLAGADFNHASQGDSPLAIARIMHREEAALALVEAGATE